MPSNKNPRHSGDMEDIISTRVRNLQNIRALRTAEDLDRKLLAEIRDLLLVLVNQLKSGDTSTKSQDTSTSILLD